MKLIVMSILLLSINAVADTDYTCLTDCQRLQYNYAFCKERCSYGESMARKEYNYRSSADDENTRKYNTKNAFYPGKYSPSGR